MLPLLLSKVRWTRVAGFGAAAVIIVLILFVRLQQVALSRDLVVYKNQAVIHKVRVVRIQGPVRIVTRTIKTPDREEIVREEVQEAVTEVQEAVHVAVPVLPPAARADRWLVGAMMNPVHVDVKEEWTALAGYSIRNRVDLCGGLTQGGRARLLIMLRF